MKANLRPVTDAEWQLYARERPAHVRMLWGVVVIEGGEVVGHGFISDIDGTTWLHDLEVWAKDRTALARLMLQGREFLRSNGRSDDVFTHVKAGSATHEFYKRRGFQEGELILRGAI